LFGFEGSYFSYLRCNARVLESAQFGREVVGAMNRLVLGAGVAAFLLVSSECGLASSAGREPAERVALGGAVYSAQDNHRIDHADVRLCDAHGSSLETQISDASGEFSFRGLAPGSYTLAVAAVGFEHQDLPVDLSLTSDLGVAVYLKPESGKLNGAAPATAISAHEMTMPQEARDKLAAAKAKLWRDKNLEGGITDVQQVVAATPNYYEAYCEMGLAYLMMGKIADAEASFRKSLEVSGGKYGDAEVGLGSTLINKGDVSGGEVALRHGIESSPGSWLGRYELSKLELSHNRVDDAEKLAEQARSLAPNFPSVYRVLANIHMRQKNYPAVLHDIDAYLQLDPNSPAGVRAKQLRDEVRQKMTTEVATAPTGAAAP
jgi:tetratricopeptide (TPR) repeat protein